MDFQQLRTALKQLGVTPKEVNRASLYINYLYQARTYFNTTLAGTVQAGGLGPDYPFVKQAVQSPSLLQELADILDFFIASAVNADLKRAYAPLPNGLGHGGNGGWTYQQYFDNVILNANAQTYQQNVLDFMGRYPIADYALGHLYTNFKENIYLACQRIIADEDLLTNFYSDLYEEDFSILSLKKIKSTGSDFHKGGKQVLILTFTISHLVYYGVELGFAPSIEELKVVYKPNDLEADCLIIGDSAAVNKVINNFMTSSLVEIYNTRLAAYKQGNPGFTGEALPTYRILPRNYISVHQGGYPLPIRNAYGYIEYLDNDISGVGAQIFGYYPLGSSDYLIFKSDNEQAITRKFYRQEGALTALACTFSLLDLHIENLRVKRYEPYLIDLEVCLTSAIDSVQETVLIANRIGAINAFHVNFDPSKRKWIVTDRAGSASISWESQDEYFQNRLWRWLPNYQKQLVRVVNNDLLSGFADGMTVLKAEVTQVTSAFIAWFARLNDVLVRVLPYSTTDFTNIRNSIFIDVFNSPSRRNSQYAEQKDYVLLRQLTDEFYNYQVGDLPNYLVWQTALAGVDYDNLDIPVFYHRIGTQDIVNSSGAQVAIPANITIFANPNPPLPPPMPPTQQAVVNIGRATFFPNFPTSANVDAGQVQILGAVNTFNQRVATLRQTIQTGLGVNADLDPAEIVPVDKQEEFNGFN